MEVPYEQLVPFMLHLQCRQKFDDMELLKVLEHEAIKFVCNLDFRYGSCTQQSSFWATNTRNKKKKSY